MKKIGLIISSLSVIISISAHPIGGVEADADSCVHLEEVDVSGFTGRTSIREVAVPVSVVSKQSLRVRHSTNLIDAISRQPGLDQITTGGGISKPVIRGLGYNRVLVVAGGVRQEGQQWGDEHGVEVDANAVHSVEIQKGPASLMYGSDALAGVVVMREAPSLLEGEMYAEAATQYHSNNGLFDYTLNYRGNERGVVWDWRWSQKWAHDYWAPQDGYVPNSGFREKALGGMLGLDKGWGFSHLKLSYYHLTPGMTEVEDAYVEGGRGYALDAPFQQVRHYKVVADNSFILGDGLLKVLAGYQQNRRQEFEEEDECGLDLKLHTVNYDLRYLMPEWGGCKSNVGVVGMYQHSVNLGEEFLIPDYDLFDVGVFATVSRSFRSKLHVSGGLRYDHRRLHSLALEEEGEPRFEDFSRTFGSFSGSLGAIYNLSAYCDVKTNLSHGFRAPNISELGSNGAHEGTFRYELGNNGLEPEKSWQCDVSLDFASGFFSSSVALFLNHIDNYIFLSRTDGEADGSPVYCFTSGSARVMGGEARLILHLLNHLHFENNFSCVDARLLNADPASRYLPFTPAPRWLSMLHYDLFGGKSNLLRNFFAEVESDYHFRQDHIMSANDTETATPDYHTLNVTLGADFHLPTGRKFCSLSLSVSNLLNTAYQSHLSRLKYADTYDFTGRRGFNNMGRSIGVKLLFPLDLSHD